MSRFNLSHYRLASWNMGELIPIGLVEALPGDRIRHSTSAAVRLSPLTAPVMHPVEMRIHHFFVPHRLTWNGDETGDLDDWETFVTGGSDGNDASSPPTIATTATEGDLLDYLGLPQVASINVNAMPVRAFNMVFNEWYRDQDLVTARALDDLTIPKVAWPKDYFTTCRPWAQKGDDVVLPLGTQAPVRGIGKFNQTYGAAANQTVYETSDAGTTTYAASQTIYDGTANGTFYVEEDPNNSGFPGIYTDLSQATGASVNAVRRAFALQRWAEDRARYGSRYAELLRHDFRTRPQDSRLQRPEFLGGGTTKVNISEVIQTAPQTDQTEPTEYGVGDLYGHGIASGRTATYSRAMPEHGYILSCVSLRPAAMYQDGIHRTWLRQDREDFYTPQLQFIGQQEVLVNEVYADVTNGGNTFGFQDRYAEYKSVPSGVSGEFRSTLDYWHLARQFASEPTLNASFIQCNPSDRIFNVAASVADTLWGFFQHRLVASRRVSSSGNARIL